MSLATMIVRRPSARRLVWPVIAATALMIAEPVLKTVLGGPADTVPVSTVPAPSAPPPAAMTRVPADVADSAAALRAAEFAREESMTPSELMDRWRPLIAEASHRFGISQSWIKAVMRMESGGRTLWDSKPITSDAGAMGIMQVMPETYEEMRQQYGLGNDPYDPHDNVLAGAAYLRRLYEKYGYPEFFAAYNAGPAAVEAHADGARPLPAETRAYLSGIARILKTTFAPAPGRPATVMLTRPDGSPVAIDPAKVRSVRAALPREYAPGVQTVVALGGALGQGVKEDLRAVRSLLRRLGADV